LSFLNLRCVVLPVVIQSTIEVLVRGQQLSVTFHARDFHVS